MDKILLIVPNRDLRQLYHGLLFSLYIEIVPTETVSNAVMLLTIDSFTCTVLYVDDDAYIVETFLNLRKRHNQWVQTKIVLLTYDEDKYKTQLNLGDVTLNPLKLSPQDIAENVISSLV